MPLVVDTRRPAGMQSRSYRSRKSRGRISRRTRYRKRKQPLALKQHNFVERVKVDDQIVIAPEATAVGLFKTFKLSDIRQDDSYTDIFEMYRIDKVVVTFRYKQINNATEANGRAQNEVNPLLYFKVDHNDNTSDSMITLKESMRTKEHQFSNDKPNFTITLKPAIQAEAYRTSLTSGYTPKWGQWLNCADAEVPHYGLKAYCLAYRDGAWNPGNLTVEYKYYVSFKNNE